jgi:hypothetical protein
MTVNYEPNSIGALYASLEKKKADLDGLIEDLWILDDVDKETAHGTLMALKGIRSGVEWTLTLMHDMRL